MEIGLPAIFGVGLLPAVAFSLAYPSLVNRLSRGLVSSYAKADARRRLRAACVDAWVAVTLAVLSATTGVVLYLGLSAGYLLMLDAIAGQSIGKLLLGLVVIDLESGRPTSWSGSVKRNLVLLLPGANVAAVFLDGGSIRSIASTGVAGNPFSRKLGDVINTTAPNLDPHEEEAVEGAPRAIWVQFK